MRVLLTTLASALVLASPGWAEGRAEAGAEQMAGLFVQSCVRFAGDAKALRQWAGGVRLPPLPPQGQEAFLKGRPGIAYDATNSMGKFVVISGDDGSCSAIAQVASPSTLLDALERLLTGAGLRLAPASDHNDPEEKALHWQDYRVLGGTRPWRVAVGTASGASGGQALLSISQP